MKAVAGFRHWGRSNSGLTNLIPYCQNIKISKYQNIKISKYQNIKISKYLWQRVNNSAPRTAVREPGLCRDITFYGSLNHWSTWDRHHPYTSHVSSQGIQYDRIMKQWIDWLVMHISASFTSTSLLAWSFSASMPHVSDWLNCVVLCCVELFWGCSVGMVESVHWCICVFLLICTVWFCVLFAYLCSLVLRIVLLICTV